MIYYSLTLISLSLYLDPDINGGERKPDLALLTTKNDFRGHSFTLRDGYAIGLPIMVGPLAEQPPLSIQRRSLLTKTVGINHPLIVSIYTVANPLLHGSSSSIFCVLRFKTQKWAF